ncbi:MAG: hypothetical protein WC002_00430 [Candidatus Muiribacteriota bacterium]
MKNQDFYVTSIIEKDLFDKNYIIIDSELKKINYVIAKQGEKLFVLKLKKRVNNKFYFDNEKTVEVNLAGNLPDLTDGPIDVLDFIKFISSKNIEIKYIKNDSEFLNKNQIEIGIIPVFDNYSKLDDNIDYYLKSFRISLANDPHHPLNEKLKKTYCELLAIKSRKAIQNKRLEVVEHLYNDNREYFLDDSNLSFLYSLYLYNKNDLYLAAEILFKIIESGNPKGETTVLLSRILDEIDKTDQALKIIEDNEINNNVDEVFVLEYLRLLLKKEEMKKMGTILNKYKSMFDNSQESNSYFKYYEGLYNMIIGEVNKALEIFESIRGSVVDDVYLRLNILQIYKLLGMKNEFMLEKNKIFELYPFISGEIVEKIEMWEKEFELKKTEEYLVMKNKENKKEQTENLELKKALEEAIKFVEDNPDNPWGFYSLGSLFLKIGDIAKAEENFKKSIEIEEENSIVLHGLGIVYTKLNKIEEAIEMFKKAIVTKVDSETQNIYAKWKYDSNLAYFSLADAYIKIKKIDEAILVLTKGLEFDASSFMPHFQLGTCYEFKKEYFKALECYVNVKKLNKTFYLVDFYIANCYTVLKDYKKAYEFMKSYLENDKELVYKGYAEEVLKKIASKLD